MLFPTNPTTEFYTTEGCHIIEIINRPDHEDVSIARARVAPGISNCVRLLSWLKRYYRLTGSHIKLSLSD